MMVTGDHPLTAEAIGRKINLMLQDTKPLVAQKRGVPADEVPESDCNAIVIHGEQIDRLTDMDWDTIFSKDEIIFARTSPKHKLQIVKRAQAHGHIVGVTGDGVNDSPALKKADLGIAMNQSGSDVSKEAAAMILVDDNFASTVSGVEEGRLIFQNLKKSVQYTVTHTMPQGLFFRHLLFLPCQLYAHIHTTPQKNSLRKPGLHHRTPPPSPRGNSHPRNRPRLRTLPRPLLRLGPSRNQNRSNETHSPQTRHRSLGRALASQSPRTRQRPPRRP